MNAEGFALKLVGDARFHLRKKLEDQAGTLPVIEIPYMKGEFRKIKENFETIRQYAEVNHLNVSFAKDGTNHLRWSYSFDKSITFCNSNE